MVVVVDHLPTPHSLRSGCPTLGRVPPQGSQGFLALGLGGIDAQIVGPVVDRQIHLVICQRDIG